MCDQLPQSDTIRSSPVTSFTVHKAHPPSGSVDWKWYVRALWCVATSWSFGSLLIV
jgi:hypothetical protein